MGLENKIKDMILSVPKDADTIGWVVYVHESKLIKQPIDSVLGFNIIPSSLCPEDRMYFMKEVQQLSEL